MVILNIWGGTIMNKINNVSVWWHVFGASLVILILIILPESHMSFSEVFSMRVNNSGGLHGGGTDGWGFWFYVLPLGFLLTQYTITGFDASAHLSEETHGAANTAAKGLWKSIFYSAIGGWFLLLAFLFAVQNAGDVTAGGGGVAVILNQALDAKVAGFVLLISAFGQLFCSTACMTSTSRMTYAFSRDGAVPGARLWAKLNKNHIPANAVVLAAVVAIIITLPALLEVNIGTEEAPIIVPTAFYAVVSVAVIGLFLSFLVPIWYRWRMGDKFPQGSWNLGKKWKWMAPLAIIEIVVVSVYFILPFTPAGTPGWLRWLNGSPSAEEVPFSWKFVNYAPILTIGALILLWIGWHLSAKKWFTGPKTTIDLPAGVSSADEIALEHEHKGFHQPPNS